MKLKSAVWFITSVCNFDCAYCDIRAFLKKKEPKERVDAGHWIEAWNRLKPDILDITGGEPFLVPDLVEIINGLDQKTKVAITTNGSGKLIDFIQRVDLKKIRCMTLSYHLNAPLSLTDFVSRCVLIASHGVDITINTVAYPPYISEIAAARRMFERLGFRFHVDTYMEESGHYELSADDRGKLEAQIGNDRKYLLDAQTLPDAPMHKVLCSAGVDHLSVYQNGDAWRCLSDAIAGRKKVGNILSPDFKLLARPKICTISGMCSGCDHDKTKREEI